MVAPAELPPITPPRSNTLRNSCKVSVWAYESTIFHCRPPSNQTPLASCSTLANSSVFATFGSCVCSIQTLVRPRFFQGASTCSGRYCFTVPSGLRFPPAVGTTTILAANPPALLTNVSKIPVPASEPPPWMTSVPRAGPYSGSCAKAAVAARIAAKIRFALLSLITYGQDIMGVVAQVVGLVSAAPLTAAAGACMPRFFVKRQDSQGRGPLSRDKHGVSLGKCAIAHTSAYLMCG